MPDAFEVSGLAELARRLDQLPLALARQVARPALEEAGEIIQATAEQSAPRKTGELAEDIVVVVKIGGDLANMRVMVGPGYPGPGMKTRKRGRYAGFLPDWKKAYVRLKAGEKMPDYVNNL